MHEATARVARPRLTFHHEDFTGNGTPNSFGSADDAEVCVPRATRGTANVTAIDVRVFKPLGARADPCGQQPQHDPVDMKLLALIITHRAE